MPWAMSSSLGDDKLFFGPKQNNYAFFTIILVYLIWYYYLSVKFVMWIVKQKIENKIIFLKKLHGSNENCKMKIIIVKQSYESNI